jgi:hypothetical protein
VNKDDSRDSKSVCEEGKINNTRQNRWVGSTVECGCQVPAWWKRGSSARGQSFRGSGRKALIHEDRRYGPSYRRSTLFQWMYFTAQTSHRKGCGNDDGLGRRWTCWRMTPFSSFSSPCGPGRSSGLPVSLLDTFRNTAEQRALLVLLYPFIPCIFKDIADPFSHYRLPITGIDRQSWTHPRRRLAIPCN